ncbi:unnamed protein product [Urochloa decumbens]|uniref:non-specific serine/threonine protein kinase n=1 Tax=Urochloa decumbens TaxID=240449 RepID=A0ABC9CFA7_9POAL
MPFQTLHVTTLLLFLFPAGCWADSTGGNGHGQFVYNGFTGANLTIDGAATVMPNGLLMLTNGTIQMTGHAFHPSPLPFRDPDAQNATAARAAGLAFFVAAVRAVLSTAMPAQFLGLLNGSDNGNRSTHIFAVELDTLFNVDIGDMNKGTAYVGFSSATGMVFSRHFVVGWSFSLQGSAPALNISGLPALPPAGPKPRSKVLEIVLPISSAALVLVVGIAIYALVRHRVKYAELRDDWEIPFGAHRFSYRDLFHATRGFSDKQLLGAGGFGRVYKGVLHKADMDLAVKRVPHESKQGTKEFISEIASLGRLRHRNIVQLLGYCRRKGELLLVYDYMPNGSLDKYLYDGSKDTWHWSQRFHIIRGVASGLLYLHEDWEQGVIHGDVKASNVLLDGDMNGRLGDFGLARLYDHGDDAYTTHVVGTMGYVAPELGHTGKATPATDVFAFGAFLLEVACGRRPVEQDQQNNCIMLVDRVIENWRKGLIINVVDSRILDGFNPQEVSLVLLKLGLLCSHPMPNRRPTMRQVIQYLDRRQYGSCRLITIHQHTWASPKWRQCTAGII